MLKSKTALNRFQLYILNSARLCSSLRAVDNDGVETNKEVFVEPTRFRH